MHKYFLVNTFNNYVGQKKPFFTQAKYISKIKSSVQNIRKQPTHEVDKKFKFWQNNINFPCDGSIHLTEQ